MADEAAITGQVVITDAPMDTKEMKTPDESLEIEVLDNPDLTIAFDIREIIKDTVESNGDVLVQDDSCSIPDLQDMSGEYVPVKKDNNSTEDKKDKKSKKDKKEVIKRKAL